MIIEGASDTDPTVTGAELDSMRALRVISGVSYPFLTRPDEFVPVSAGELSDKITSEGFGAVNGYLDGTLRFEVRPAQYLGAQLDLGRQCRHRRLGQRTGLQQHRRVDCQKWRQDQPGPVLPA